jgi:trans-feruloyl-CoA hydratase/vanillin synthase
MHAGMAEGLRSGAVRADLEVGINVTEKSYQNVLIEREGGITFVVLNRPGQRNAMSPELHYEMEDAIDAIAADKETKVLVLTGAGESWCAGQDIRLYFRATQDDPDERQRSNAASHRWRWEKLKAFPKPTIAMVNGYCYGAAFTQLCAVDFVITAEDAVYGLSEVNWGIIPGGIVGWNLTDMILPRHALYYAVTGEPFDGKRAVEIGLANFAVPKERLRQETVRLADKLMKLNPGVVRYTKEAMRAVRGMSDDQARDYLRSKQDSLMRSDKEIRDQVGMKQFLDEKTYRPGFGPYRREDC